MQWWKRPVTVETKEVGQRMDIESTEAATDYLLSHWPRDPGGNAFDAAKAVLLDAFDGKRPPSEARQAFVAALREANIAVFED